MVVEIVIMIILNKTYFQQLEALIGQIVYIMNRGGLKNIRYGIMEGHLSKKYNFCLLSA